MRNAKPLFEEIATADPHNFTHKKDEDGVVSVLVCNSNSAAISSAAADLSGKPEAYTVHQLVNATINWDGWGEPGDTFDLFGWSQKVLELLPMRLSYDSTGKRCLVDWVSPSGEANRARFLMDKRKSPWKEDYAAEDVILTYMDKSKPMLVE